MSVITCHNSSGQVGFASSRCCSLYDRNILIGSEHCRCRLYEGRCYILMFLILVILPCTIVRPPPVHAERLQCDQSNSPINAFAPKNALFQVTRSLQSLILAISLSGACQEDVAASTSVRTPCRSIPSASPC